jgi:hypothetical protein
MRRGFFKVIYTKRCGENFSLKLVGTCGVLLNKISSVIRLAARHVWNPYPPCPASQKKLGDPASGPITKDWSGAKLLKPAQLEVSFVTFVSISISKL